MSNGWSQADANGFYWWRYDKDDTPQPVEVRDGFFYSIADRSPTSVSFGEFLGPITPTDAERLVKLEKGAKAAIQLINDLYDDEAIPTLMQYQVDGVKSQLQAALEER